jgi:UDP-GlcNAc:undecaprenyl-phosphate/decaprenyl-phosphate GlcNAc-1-phosphate transferase
MESLWKGLLQNSLLLAGLKAFAISLILTPILRDIFRSYNVVDRPGQRHLHPHPIPRIGGLAIAAAYTVAVFPLGELPLWKLLPGAALIFLTGLLDDFFTLKPIFKLAGQTAAALLVFFNGLSVGTLGRKAPLPMWLDLPVTVLWLLLTTNALNLIDGLDGLCAGIGSIATLAMFGAAWLYGNQPLAYATLPLACALLAFLCYNLSPATVFLGDSGALLIGFLLGCYGMIWTQKTSTLLSLLAPLIALSVPLLDVSVSIFRRILRRQPIFSADRAHIHHRLLDRGLTPRRAVLVLYGFGAMAAALALLLIAPQMAPFRKGLLVLLVAGVGLGLRELRYKEFDLVGRLLFGGELQRNLEESLRLDNLSAALAAAPTREAWWIALSEAARECGWSRIQWKKPGGSSEVSIHPLAATDWIFSVPLGEMGTIEIQGRPGLRGLDLAAFASAIRRSAGGFEPLVAARAEAV